jgi:hypothetical protein
LGRWVGRQREAKHQKKKLSAEREAKLNAIGFIWKVCCKTAWDTRFGQLEDFKKANGDCNVSTDHSQTIQLGRWVIIQRHLRRKMQLSEEREAKLNSIGFVWIIRKGSDRFSVKHVDWNVHFGQLLAYKLAVGDCNVPKRHRPNPQLGRWVQTQRLKSKNQKLTKEHWEQLNSIEFYWGKQSCARIARNQQLEKYKRTHHGLCDVPDRCCVNNPPHLHKLATAHLYNNGQKEVLETESVAELKTTDNENCWDVHFRELLAYLQIHGNHNVPLWYPCNPLLARWVSEQRNDYDRRRCGKQTSLTPLREAKLDAIGFTWFVRGIEEDAPAAEGVSSGVQPEEARSGNM